MNQRERNDLDRHITGNYGEDRFRYEHEDGTPYDEDEIAAAMDREDERAAFENEVESWINRAIPRIGSMSGSQRLYKLLQRIAAAYDNDPGVSDLDDEQPVTFKMTLGDVRLARELLR